MLFTREKKHESARKEKSLGKYKTNCALGRSELNRLLLDLVGIQTKLAQLRIGKKCSQFELHIFNNN